MYCPERKGEKKTKEKITRMSHQVGREGGGRIQIVFLWGNI